MYVSHTLQTKIAELAQLNDIPTLSYLLFFCINNMVRQHERFDGTVRNLSRLFSDLKLA